MNNKIRSLLSLLLASFAFSAMASSEPTEASLSSVLAQLKAIQEEISILRAEQLIQKQENEQLRRRLTALQNGALENETHVVSAKTFTSTEAVNLELEEQPSVQVDTASHVLSNPWFQNIEISGFGAIGYYNTGSAGARNHGSFEVKESSLFIEGSVWDNISYFLEFQINRLGIDPRDPAPNTGEAYVHVREIPFVDEYFGLKVGRIDLPFGEEYLWQDAIDNPLITNSASYAYGWDEGVLIYGNYRNVDWIAAVTDGTNERSRDKNSQKAINLKASGNLTDSFYVSASYMNSGDSPENAIEFGGAHPMPIGTDLGSRDSFRSTLGDSSSDEVATTMVELDGKFEFSVRGKDAYLALTLGKAKVDDDDSTFDRDFMWFTVEPYLQINRHWYALARYSEIGTYDDDEGYLFGGKIFAKGLVAGGYDTERLRRIGIGVGWMPNPRLRTKFEIGKDWLDVIDASTLQVNDSRNFIGFEAAVGF